VHGKDLSLELPDGIKAVCLEFPKDVPLTKCSWSAQTMLIARVQTPSLKNAAVWYTSAQVQNESGEQRALYLPIASDMQGSDDHLTMEELLLNTASRETSVVFDELKKQIYRIAILVCLVSKMHADVSLLTPVLMKKCQEKGATATHEALQALIEKSKRNGVYGWDLGRDLPDTDQIEKMRKEAIERGVVSPHWRSPHFSRRLIGTGEKKHKEWRFISGSFVNKDMLLSVPQGYYDKDVANHQTTNLQPTNAST
jgi:hypothetical protein